MNRILPAAAAAAFALLLTGCSSGAGAPAVSVPDSTPASTGQEVTPPPPSRTPAASPPLATGYPAGWTLPDRKLSPGAVQPGYGIRDICPHVSKALEAMRPSSADKTRIYAAYGITRRVPGQYEIDHIIPVELLGLVAAPAAQPTENLYPELNDRPDPAVIAREHLDPAFIHNSKDIVEDVLHRDVCHGQVPLATAQHAIMTDWRVAYGTYVGPPPGYTPPSSPSRTHMSSAAPQPTHSRSISPPVPAQAACYPKTSGGNCYRAGEFCRESDHGANGIAGNGERIRCEPSGGRWRWEPA